MAAGDLSLLMTTFELFKGYTPHGTQALIDKGKLLELPAGHVLYSQGEQATTVVLVLAGEVEHFVVSHGREVRLSSVGASHVLADVQVMGEMSHPSSARTAGDATVLAWDGPTFRRLVTADSVFALRVFQQTAVSLAQQAETLTAGLAAMRDS